MSTARDWRKSFSRRFQRHFAAEMSHYGVGTSADYTRNEKVRSVAPSDAVISMAAGAGVTAVTAPLIHPFNNIAAVAARDNVSSKAAARTLYRGGVGSLPQNNVKNFFTAMSTGHGPKELIRLPAKTYGLIYLKPWLDNYFQDKDKSAAAFAGSLSIYEMFVANVFDSYKSQIAVNGKFVLSKAYNGAVGNGIRQFLTWFGYGEATSYMKARIQSYGIDPESAKGMALMAPVQAAAFTAIAYPTFEIALRKAQVSEDVKPKNAVEVMREWKDFLYGKTKPPESFYLELTKKIYAEQGLKGFVHGVGAKYAGNTVLAYGATSIPVVAKWLARAFLGQKMLGQGEDVMENRGAGFSK